MTTVEALAFVAGLLWAVAWCVIGFLFSWWAAAVGFVVGGVVGAFLAMMAFGLLLEIPPRRSWIGMAVEIIVGIVGLAAYLSLPVFVFRLVRDLVHVG